MPVLLRTYTAQSITVGWYFVLSLLAAAVRRLSAHATSVWAAAAALAAVAGFAALLAL